MLESVTPLDVDCGNTGDPNKLEYVVHIYWNVYKLCDIKKNRVSRVYWPEFLSHSAFKSCFMNNASFMEEATCISQKYNLMTWSSCFTDIIWMRHRSVGASPTLGRGLEQDTGPFPPIYRVPLVSSKAESCAVHCGLRGTAHTSTRTQRLLGPFHYPSEEFGRVNSRKHPTRALFRLEVLLRGENAARNHCSRS